jgi:hypothetical protein
MRLSKAQLKYYNILFTLSIFLLSACHTSKCTLIEGHFEVVLTHDNFIGKCRDVKTNDSLVYILYKYLGRDYKLMYCPIFFKKIDSPILYQYWQVKVPLKTDNYFRIESDSIVFFNQINDSMKIQLQKYKNTSKDINRTIIKMNKCNLYNQKISSNF